eukprot:3690867-Amphidinium_carterae.1
MADGVDLLQVPEPLESKKRTASPTNANVKRAKPRAGGTNVALPCLVCSEPRYQRKRFCRVHKNTFECMCYYFTDKASARNKDKTDEEMEVIKKEFLETMKDDDQAVKSVMTWQAHHVSCKKLAKKPDVTWADFVRELGVSVGRRTQSIESPTECEEWVSTLMAKGWTRSAAAPQLARHQCQRNSYYQ